jgi:hypothetical protein
LLPHFRPGRGLCDRPCDNCILSIGLEPWQKPPNPATFLSGKLMRPSGRAPPGVHIRRPIHGLQISNLCSISVRSGLWAWPPSSLMAYLVNGKARCRAPDCARPYRRCCWYRGGSKEDLHREAFPFYNLLGVLKAAGNEMVHRVKAERWRAYSLLGPPLPASLNQHSV